MDACARLSRTVEAFCRIVEALPAEVVAEQDWGAKEVLAHLLGYHELYVRAIEAALGGALFKPPAGRYGDLNARAVAASRGVPASALLQRLRAANARLCQLYAGCKPIQVTILIKQGVKPRTLEWLIPEVEAHVRGHHEALRRAHRAAG